MTHMLEITYNTQSYIEFLPFPSLVVIPPYYPYSHYSFPLCPGGLFVIREKNSSVVTISLHRISHPASFPPFHPLTSFAHTLLKTYTLFSVRVKINKRRVRAPGL